MGHVEFQRQRADIADGQTLTPSQYYYTIITPRAALAETIHGVQCYPTERPVPPWLATPFTSGGTSTTEIQAIQKYRHAGTLKQAGLGVWGKFSGQRPQRAAHGAGLSSVFKRVVISADFNLNLRTNLRSRRFLFEISGLSGHYQLSSWPSLAP